MDASQAAETVGVLAPAPLKQIIEVAEAPRDQSQSRNAEQGVENLRVDFQPFLSSTGVVVVGWVGQRWGSVTQDEEKHATPRNNVQAVDGDEESGGGQEELPEADETNLGGVPFRVLWGELIAIGIREGRVVRRQNRSRGLSRLRARDAIEITALLRIRLLHLDDRGLLGVNSD